MVGFLGAADWFQFAAPLSLLLALMAFAVIYLLFVRGMSVELNDGVLRREYAALGPINRDEMVVLSMLCLQIFGWLTRKDLTNNLEVTDPVDLSGVGDDTIACTAAVALFLLPSAKRPGETVLTWDVAQKHLPWGVLLLMGGGFALAEGFKVSRLTAWVGEKIAGFANMDPLGLTFLIVFCVCFLTEVTSNTVTASIMLPILEGVAIETLKHPLALMLPATAACSFAFMLPAATPPNSVVFATKRVALGDFVRAGLIINILSVLTGSLVMYGMAGAVYDVLGPFPKWACLPESCRWVDVPGVVRGRQVSSQACSLTASGLCRLHDGTLLNVTGQKP